VILVDAGPLLALVNRSDRSQVRCVAALRSIDGPLGTAWPVLAEALDDLQDSPEAQAAVWQMLERGVVQVLALEDADVPRLRQLALESGAGLGAAAVLRLSERERLRTVFTLQPSVYAAYRLKSVPEAVSGVRARGRRAAAREPRRPAARPVAPARGRRRAAAPVRKGRARRTGPRRRR
jgi:hypothetical protein